MVPQFALSSTPNINFGEGTIRILPKIIMGFGRKVLLVTGRSSFLNGTISEQIFSAFSANAFHVETTTIKGEPSPAQIDKVVQRFRSFGPDVVVSIGGGSVIDAGKAISAMLPSGDSVANYLEGVGTKQHNGIKVPFIAVPTTSGTGSEATKNAVLTIQGENGYKKSLRHNNFVPDYAIVDPLLTISCSKKTTASSGMDAFSQLLESYLSINAGPMTNALALEGMGRLLRSIEIAVTDGNNTEARSNMSYAAMISGITLANAGLGLVHGFAQPLGSFFGIPHGEVCGTLIGAVNRVTVNQLRECKLANKYLSKYAKVGRLMRGASKLNNDDAIDALLDKIDELIQIFEIPQLSQYGITENDFDLII